MILIIIKDWAVNGIYKELILKAYLHYHVQ